MLKVVKIKRKDVGEIGKRLRLLCMHCGPDDRPRREFDSYVEAAVHMRLAHPGKALFALKVKRRK